MESDVGLNVIPSDALFYIGALVHHFDLDPPFSLKTKQKRIITKRIVSFKLLLYTWAQLKAKVIVLQFFALG